MSNLTNDCEDGMLSNEKPESSLDDEPHDRDCGGRSGGVVLKKGPWTSAEDAILIDYVKKHGEGNWNAVQKHSGLSRCGKSCRLRWANHLRPNLKKGAFTQDEERLIIELHAKMGNKWARMAAYLPGRTDNEIKNYWNTRIKRLQRAGLPLYPEDVRRKLYLERQNSGVTNEGDNGPNDLLRSNSFEIPDVTFDGLKTNQNLLHYVPELPNIPPYHSFMPPVMHRQKRLLREPTALFSGYGGSVKNESLYDQFQDDASFNFGQLSGSHTLSNGNYSTSESELGTVKLELPSFQYPESELGNWGPLDNVDAFIQSPAQSCRVESDCVSPRHSGLLDALVRIESDCVSPKHSGLLDALVHEAKSKNNSAKNHSSEKCSSSSTPGDVAESGTLTVPKTEWENYGDPLSPLAHSATSLFSDCAPITVSGSSLDETSADIAGNIVKPGSKKRVWTADKETPTFLDHPHYDTMFGSSWLEHGSSYDAITTLLDEDSDRLYKPLAQGTSSSQEWGYDSCSWNNMPGVYQMSELP